VELFEIGHTFQRPKAPDAPLPEEREVLAAVLAGSDATAAVQLWRFVAEALGVEQARVENGEVPGLHPTRSGHLRAAGTLVGHAGEVDPGVLDAYGIGERVGYLEVDLTTLLDLPHGEQRWRPFSLFPSSDIDLAFEVDDAVPATAVEASIRAAAGDLLWSVSLFDVYRGAGVGEGRRSLAFTLRLQAAERTLTDADVAEVRSAVIDAVQRQHPATLRG
jgi:phenylalanyl-tRNA synthetase beta chain